MFLIGLFLSALLYISVVAMIIYGIIHVLNHLFNDQMIEDHSSHFGYKINL